MLFEALIFIRRAKKKRENKEEESEWKGNHMKKEDRTTA